MAPPKGNKFGTKLKDPAIRQRAYREYCDHIADGKSKKAWHFRHKDLTCTWQTMEKYIKENPNEFNPIHKEIAESMSLDKWETRGLNMMLGKIKKCQPAIYQMFMRNKFGWDKEEKETPIPTQLDGQLKILKSVEGEWKEKNA